MVDSLALLSECSYNGISFPIGPIKATLSHAATPHARADRDGAKVENSGLNPEEFSVQIYFINGLSHGLYETWDALFPQTFLRVKEEYKKRDIAKFVHPIYGELKVKPLNWSEELSPDARG